MTSGVLGLYQSHVSNADQAPGVTTFSWRIMPSHVYSYWAMPSNAAESVPLSR